MKNEVKTQYSEFQGSFNIYCKIKWVYIVTGLDEKEEWLIIILIAHGEQESVLWSLVSGLN